MRNLAIEAAGVLGIAVAVLHGVLGEKRVFARVRIEPARAGLMIRLVWQCSAVAWAGIGVLLVAASATASEAVRHWIVSVGVGVYGFGALANAVATKGRHFGWIALALVSALALAGR